MKNPDEDYAFEQRRQALVDALDFAKFDAKERGIPIHQKVGTVIPFSRTVDRDPNPRIPLSVPGDYIKVGKKEALFWVVIVGAWLAYLFFGPGEW